ncbi:MAG: two-component sensor histidine kinase [Aequorivita sp.]|nr:two-component sensor histidine kinase [Aequorivita sp.]|tara:strand:+ start:1251 stop:2609 length:1359 start_codon:yes stop_codon:yes gene_type:complete
MQLKFKGLVAISIITLIALIGIQGYLIYNTYELKKKTYTIDARNAIAKVYNTKELDSIMWLYRTDFLENLVAYEKGNLEGEDLLLKLREKTQEINPEFLKLFNDGLSKDNYNLKIKKVLTSITLTDSLGNKNEIYSTDETNDTIILLGENFAPSDGLLINNSTWQDDQTPIKLNFQSSIYMNISDWSNIMLKELSGLLILSSLLFLFVVSLLYYSIQNLMKQKRLAEIKTDFINNITHELKTPLSTLALATKTLTSEHANGNKEIADGAVKIIERQNTRLQKLIDQVLQSSLGYKQIQLSKEDFNGSVFLNEMLDDYMLSIVSPDITLNRNIESTGLPIHADKFYLSTAIINLLNNAIKYGGTKLTVDYGVDKLDSTHYISVKDNGIGISPKYQKFIFEKFYRVSEKDTHNYKGLGLGLYYTKQIINAHGGNISVKSEANKGSVFTIKIPIS